MSKDQFVLVPTPEGVNLVRCPVCGSVAEIWRRSSDSSSATETAVCCTNGQSFGPQIGELYAGCLLYMPPDEFYRATIREAVKYWTEYGKAVIELRKRAWEDMSK